MEKLSGCLMARLAESGEEYPSNLIDEINRQVHPPKPVKQNDVYIRAMYIVSDQVNSQGGCFATEDLDHLATLLVDSPVMVGHRRDSLPLARNFKAETVTQDSRTWVKSYFYWMKESEGAEDLKGNIDGGIYKECSISFLFLLPECSICGKDIRQCRHVPFQEYEKAPGQTEIAHFKYRQIERVLETSLVYRGAVADTKITDRLSPVADATGAIVGAATASLYSKDAPEAIPGRMMFGRSRVEIGSIGDFQPADGEKLFVYPYQPGLLITAHKRQAEVNIDAPIPLSDIVQKQVVGLLKRVGADEFSGDFLLYATKGKERLNGFGLMHLLKSGMNLHRLHLRCCDLMMMNSDSLEQQDFASRLERAKAIGGLDISGAFEVLQLKKISVPEWHDYQAGKGPADYRFGLELVSEDAKGVLTRHILTRGSITAAVVAGVSFLNNLHMRCELTIPGQKRGLKNITCFNLPGMDEQAVVLAAITSSATGTEVVTVKDIMPGMDLGTIGLIGSPTESESPKLHIKSDGNRLALLFPIGGAWHQAIIHHFSARLFGSGRRFVADVTPIDLDHAKIKADRTLTLKTVVRHGQLILLRQAKRDILFGDAPGLWLRPALIDGEERYLFYADDAIRRQAG